MRPGRLDRILYIGPPDLEGREEILRIRTRKMKVAQDLDIAELARMVMCLRMGWSFAVLILYRPMDVLEQRYLPFAKKRRYSR